MPRAGAQRWQRLLSLARGHWSSTRDRCRIVSRAAGQRSINCYRVDCRDFAAINGNKFKIDPQRLLYSLQWLHNGTPCDLHLQLVQEPGSGSIGALDRHEPHLFDALRDARPN